MRTNINLDDALIAEAQKVTHIKVRSRLVHFALEELVRAAKRKSTLTLEGKIKWQGSLPRMRQGRSWSL
jgi:Arc/MetJ family transcription regulator